jgi:hypothetical protein
VALEAAHELAVNALSEAKSPVHLLEGNSTLGFVFLYRGEQVQAHAEQSVALRRNFTNL